MSNFNYQKAWFVFAKPAMENLNEGQKKAFNELLPLVKDLQQEKILLNGILSEKMRDILSPLDEKELAELARATEFYGHWKPSHTTLIFDNSSGESWKVSNVIDQVLRERFSIHIPSNIQIHEGMLRVTFSSKDCWLWEEFALATPENLGKFKNCMLSFNEISLHKNAEKLAHEIGDLWDTKNVDSLPNNEAYTEYLELMKKVELEKLEERKQDKLVSLKKDIENAQKEHDAFAWLISRGIDYENCIYYNHTDKFCFGWRNKLTPKEMEDLTVLLKGFPYKVEFKTL